MIALQAQLLQERAAFEAEVEELQVRVFSHPRAFARSASPALCHHPCIHLVYMHTCLCVFCMKCVCSCGSIRERVRAQASVWDCVYSLELYYRSRLER